MELTYKHTNVCNFSLFQILLFFVKKKCYLDLLVTLLRCKCVSSKAVRISGRIRLDDN